MPTWKATLFIQVATNVSNPNLAARRLGGWSESWYSGANNLQALLANLLPGPAVPGQFGPNSLVSGRAGILPFGAVIVGVRVQSINPLAQAQSIAVQAPGVAQWPTDTPQQALLCKVPGLNVANIRRTILRCIPDQYVIQGEFAPDNAYTTALVQFFQTLQNWQFRGRDLSQPITKIVNITVGTAITVTTETPVSPTVGSFVRILKSKDSTGALRGGRFQVLSIGPGNNVFTIGLWPYGATTGGSMRVDGIVYPAVDFNNVAIGRIITRRVGRPFTQYRGRRSRKR